MQGKPSEGKVFDLDIAKYVAASQMAEYLSQGFKDRYEYPLRSFVFHPFVGVRFEDIYISLIVTIAYLLLFLSRRIIAGENSSFSGTKPTMGNFPSVSKLLLEKGIKPPSFNNILINLILVKV